MENTKYKEIYKQEVDNSALRTKAKNIVKMLIEQDESQAYQHVEEQDLHELMYEVSRRVRQIPLDKNISVRRIKEILADDKVTFNLNDGADLNATIKRDYNRFRFYQYSQQLLDTKAKGIRGHYFEGLLAGLFNGEVVSTMEGEMVDPKEDVLIDGVNYSAKLVRKEKSNTYFGTGSLLGGFKQAVIQRLKDKGINPDELIRMPITNDKILYNKIYELLPEEDREMFQQRHMRLFFDDDDVPEEYKRIVLKHAFSSRSEEEIGIPLNWIFGVIEGTHETFGGDELPKANLIYLRRVL